MSYQPSLTRVLHVQTSRADGGYEGKVEDDVRGLRREESEHCLAFHGRSDCQVLLGPLSRGNCGEIDELFFNVLTACARN